MRRLAALAVAAAGTAVAVWASTAEPLRPAEQVVVEGSASDTRPDWARCATEEVPGALIAPHLPSAVVVALRPVADLPGAVAAAARPGTAELWVALLAGEVLAVDEAGQSRPVLDLSAEVSQGGERGFFSLAFSPPGDRLYLSYTDLSGASRVDEVVVTDDGGVSGPRRPLLRVEQPWDTHNGGDLAVAPDGILFVALGDGGYPMAGDWEIEGDGLGRAQDVSDPLGSVLRIDPRAHGDQPYRIPSDNPFVGVDGARPEIWAYGLRNPWRLSLDPPSGDLWVADVGHYCWEEINRLAGADGAGAGANLGWNRYEGRHRFRGEPLDQHVLPVRSYGRDEGCGVVGGHVYRGAALPELTGAYIHADLCQPELRALVPLEGPGWGVMPLGVHLPGVVSFAPGGDGELYAVSLASGVHRLEPARPRPPGVWRAN